MEYVGARPVISTSDSLDVENAATAPTYLRTAPVHGIGRIPQKYEEIEMRKIVAGLFVSLDGVVEAPETWHFPYFNDEMAEAVASQMAAADTMLLGRRTYEEFAAYWADKGSEVELADQINNTPKLVASTTLKEVEWRNSTLIEGNVAEQLRRLKEEPGKDISITGSGTLVRSLLRDKVLDELRLLVHPIVVGAGKRLFEATGDRVALKLVDSRTFSTGVLYLTYEPAER
jgi:dihydrofolate reductase